MRHLRISSIIAIALVCGIFTEELVWAAGGLQMNCLAPETQMDIEAQAEPFPEPPFILQGALDFQAAYFGIGVGLTELLRQYPELWYFSLAGICLGFAFYWAHIWIDKVVFVGRTGKWDSIIAQAAFVAVLLLGLVSVYGDAARYWPESRLPGLHKSLLLGMGLAAGAILRYKMEGLFAKIAARFRKPAVIPVPLGGWGSGRDSVILDKKIPNVNQVRLPDADIQHLRVLAFGLSKKELKGWAGRLLNEFEAKGHTVKRAIFSEKRDIDIIPEGLSAVTHFNPHVVIVPHNLDKRTIVPAFNDTVRAYLELKAREGNSSFVFIEYETPHLWYDFLERFNLSPQRRRFVQAETEDFILPSFEAQLSDFEEQLKAYQNEVKEHFNTYLFYDSFREKMLGKGGVFWHIKNLNADIGARRVSTMNLRREFLPLELIKLFALRFRATRIGGPQANQGPGEVTPTRIGGRQEQRIKELLFGQVALQEAM